MHPTSASSRASSTPLSPDQTSLCRLLTNSTIWLIALLCTVVTIALQLAVATFIALARLIFQGAGYLLLATVFVCSIVVLAVLSIITLGAVSLP